MDPAGARPLVLDAGALIAVERANARVVGLLGTYDQVHIPAGVLAQVWRDPARQVRLVRTVTARQTTVHPLDEDVARAAGQLCARTRTPDVIDASVVVLAQAMHAVVLTSDPEDLRRLAPDLAVVAV